WSRPCAGPLLKIKGRRLPMRHSISWALACAAVALSTAPCRAGGEMGKYLTKDGQLAQKLELVVEQGGTFLTGWVWTVEPSGAWSVAPLGAAGKGEVRKGKLSTKQLAALAQHLAALEFAKLPANIGRRQEGSGFQNYLISFGKKTTRLMLAPGDDLKEVVP